LNNLDKTTDSYKLILFTGSHHPREAISLSMILVITIQKLAELIEAEKWNDVENHQFWGNHKILILPVINVDGLFRIEQNFLELHGDVRKNSRITCVDKINDRSCIQGVDLNRNYDVHFYGIEDPQTKDPCSEVYRGEAPFSEPETQAVRKLVEENPQIISAMNFHCYGNLWVKPFNYVGKGEADPLLNMKEKELYDNFEKFAPIPLGGIVASALKAVDYAAPGEASDWMLEKHGIFSFSPELGYSNKTMKESYSFVVDQATQKKILAKDYPVIEYFIGRHSTFINFTTIHLNHSIAKNISEVLIIIENPTYTNISNIIFRLEGNNAQIQRAKHSVTNYTVSSKEGTVIASRGAESANIGFIVGDIPRFEKRLLRITSSSLLISVIETGVEFAAYSNDRKIIYFEHHRSEDYSEAKSYRSSVFIIGLPCLISFLVCGIVYMCVRACSDDLEKDKSITRDKKPKIYVPL